MPPGRAQRKASEDFLTERQTCFPKIQESLFCKNRKKIELDKKQGNGYNKDNKRRCRQTVSPVLS